MKTFALRQWFANYRPDRPLMFTNGKYLLYSHPRFQRNSYITQGVTFAATSFMGYQALIKNLATTGFLSFLFKNTLFAGCFMFSQHIYNRARSHVIRLYLHSDGRTLELETAPIFHYNQPGKNTLLPITEVMPPPNLDDASQLLQRMEYLHTLYTRDGREFAIMREGEVFDKKLLEKVVEGCSIDISPQDKIDVIDI